MVVEKTCVVCDRRIEVGEKFVEPPTCCCSNDTVHKKCWPEYYGHQEEQVA